MNDEENGQFLLLQRWERCDLYRPSRIARFLV